MVRISHAEISFNAPASQIFDMLRYDMCWPRRQEDVGLMYAADYGKQTKMQITTYVKGGRKKPSIEDFTPGRWQSFGVGIKYID